MFGASSTADDLLNNPLLRRELLEEREYQTNIAKEAIKRNTLVVLPTALGKTVIAALAAAHFLYNQRRKKVLIMAPTKPLVLQHRDTFMRLLKLKAEEVEVLTGKIPSSYRLKAWEGNARIYFATPQVVNNDHENGLRLNDFSFLVFDECHRARKNYAYTKVAHAYVSECPYPIILAMTASPGAERERIEEICRSLFIEHVEMRSEEDPDVQAYVGRVGLEWKLVKLPASYAEIHQKISEMLRDRLNSLSSMGVIKKHPKFIFRNDLLEAGERLRMRLAVAHGEEKGRIFGAIFLQSSAMTLYHAIELLESQGLNTLASFLERLKKSGKRSHRSLVKEMENAGIFQKLNEEEEHPKMKILEAEIKQQLLSNPSSKAIVFTQYRDTAFWIVDRLSKLGVPAERFVGQADKEGERGMSQEEQAELLNRFRNGEVKVIVATSIAEEGLDIPNVDLVIFYEPVPSEIRYIQRKGRTGRGKFGRIVILATENSLDTTYLRTSRKKVEKMKRMISQLNLRLSSIVRFGPPPPPDPMTSGELAELEALESAGREEFEELEGLKIKEFNKEVNRMAKRLLERVLKSGESGISLKELEKEEASPAVLKEAANRLLSSNFVEEINGRLVPSGVEVGKWPRTKLHVFEVEKVLPRMAILLVDEKWRAILTPESYDGPRHLLKRGSRFRAAAELYKREGRLHVRVCGIESVLS